jgi:hypothetical protein
MVGLGPLDRSRWRQANRGDEYDFSPRRRTGNRLVASCSPAPLDGSGRTDNRMRRIRQAYMWEWRRSRIKSCRPRSTSPLGRGDQPRLPDVGQAPPRQNRMARQAARPPSPAVPAPHCIRMVGAQAYLVNRQGARTCGGAVKVTLLGQEVAKAGWGSRRCQGGQSPGALRGWPRRVRSCSGWASSGSPPLLVLRVLHRYPSLLGIPARAIGIGVLPEHVGIPAASSV